jgi:hypothetical protein
MDSLLSVRAGVDVRRLSENTLVMRIFRPFREALVAAGLDDSTAGESL